MCDVPPSDLVIFSGVKFDIDNVARETDPSRFPDCSTHVMASDSSRPFRPLRPFPRSVLQADTIIVSCGLANFEVTTWSKHRCHKFWVYERN